MESEIVRCYLDSDYRAGLLNRKLDRFASKHLKIYLANSLISGGQPEDDGDIINFLRKLGDVKFEVIRDEDTGLQFDNHLFDSYISEDDLMRAYSECEDREGRIDYLDEEYCLVDGKVTRYRPEGNVRIIFHPLNFIFKVKDGPLFSEFYVNIKRKHNDEFRKCIKKLMKREYLPILLESEKPKFISHSGRLKPYPVHPKRPYVINLDSTGHIIYVIEPRRKDWLTREEALNELFNIAHHDGYAETNAYFYGYDAIEDIDLPDILNHGIVESLDEVELDSRIKPYELFSKSEIVYDTEDLDTFVPFEDKAYRSIP